MIAFPTGLVFDSFDRLEGNQSDFVDDCTTGKCGVSFFISIRLGFCVWGGISLLLPPTKVTCYQRDADIIVHVFHQT